MTSTLEPTTTALPPLKLGALAVDPAVVLAPMAGITNPAFRTLCREFGAGLYVCEMITTRALVERNAKTLRMVRATADEADAFSVQLYGVDPATVGRAVEMLVDEGVAGTRPAHIDLNFGCPVPKVTRKGGGSALPWRRRAVRATSSRSAVAGGAGRAGHRQDAHRHRPRPRHLPRRRPDRPGRGRRRDHPARPHRRPALQRHRRLVADRAARRRAVDIPVLGNGDIWEADDALRMVAETGCAGVVIGRGCLGRPWLFGDLAAAFAGRPERALPTLREVAAIMHRHADAAGGRARRAARLRRLPQARGLVPQGLLGRLGRPPRAGDGERPRRARGAARAASPTSPIRSPSSVPRGAGPARRGRWRCPRAGWPTATTRGRRRAPSWR